MKGATTQASRGDPEPLRFEILETLSERGLFGTYLAKDLALGRRVALRRPLPGIALSPELVGRVHGEATLRARCVGDRVLALFEDRSGEPEAAYVFAPPPGPSLAEVARRLSEIGGPDGAELTAVLVELAAILREVHEAGVVLGELSPDGIHVTEDRGLVLRSMDNAASPDVVAPRPTAAGEDPSHRSPEQGMGATATPASDVFLAGLVALEVALGAHPFAAEGSEITHAIRTRAPSPVPRTVGLPVELERLVARCLAKDATARPESGTALAAELAPLAPGVPAATTLRRMLERCGLAGKTTGRAAPRVEVDPRRDEAYAPVDRAKRALLAATLAMVTIGGAGRLWEKQSRPDKATPAAAEAARLFVLARPWAEIWIDGEPVETTPLARPIVVSAGKHVVVFKHPSAPDEKRFLDLSPGESTTLDVEMAVKRPAPKASGEPSP